VTVLWSIVLAIFMPDSPWKMRGLSERERKIAVLRVMSNHTGISSSHWKWEQARSVLTEPQAWIFFAIVFVQCLPGGGLTAVSSRCSDKPELRDYGTNLLCVHSSTN
jgi:hypothetical protein